MTSELAEQFVGGYGFAARILYDLMVPSGSSGTGQHPRFCHGSGITDYGPESAKKLAAATLDRHKTQKYACASCPLGWGAGYSVKDGRWPMEDTERPEYETAASFGSTCLCDEEDAVLKCNELCNRHGFDVIASAME